MKFKLLLIAISLSYVSLFAQNDLRIIKPYASDADTISICYRDSITVKVIDLGEYASITNFYSSPVEPDVIAWSNYDQWEIVWMQNLNPDSSFSVAIDEELWIWARLYDLGTVMTKVIHVTPLGTLPTIVYSDTTFCNGSTMTISANPNDLGSNNYKWFKNAVEIENEILSDLEIRESGTFNVAAKDESGACPSKFIRSEPQQFYLEQPVITGDLIPVLSRITLSTDDLYTSYMWYSGSDRDNLLLQDSSPTATSFVVNINESDMYYSLSVITQTGCTAISDTFLINKKRYDVPIITHPELLDICPESTLILHTDDFYGSYQWYKNGNAMVNENNDTLVLTGNYPYDSGKYTLKVTTELDVNSEFESDTVAINVIENPFIKSYGNAYCLGAEISFYTQGIYDNYQWYINNESDFSNAVPVGTDDSTYTFNVVEDELYYMLSATHTSCPETLYSNALRVEPYQYQSIVSIGTDDDDLNQKICYGQSVMLTARANDAEPHWFFNGELIDSLVEKEIHVEKYGNYTLSATSTKCPELEPVWSEDTVVVGSKVDINFSVKPDGEEYYVNGNPNHLIYCNGDPIQLIVNNPDNYNSWQWMGKLFNENSTLDDWEDLEDGNVSVFSFSNGVVPKLRYKVRVDSVMGNGFTCKGISSVKVIDSWVYLEPQFHIANQNTNQFCGEGDSILLKVSTPGAWGKYEWRNSGEVLQNSNVEEYYAKDTGYYQVAAYFEKCMHNPPAVSGVMQLNMFDEALILVDDDRIKAIPVSQDYHQWYYSSEDPTLNGSDILENMTPVDSDTLLRPYEIPFDQLVLGYYVVEIKNADYCVSISDVYYHNLNSIANIELGEVNIYPNPIKDILNIEVANASSIQSIQIFNAAGVVLHNITTVSSQLSISMQAYDKGVYFVKINFENSNSTVEKIIIQ